MNWHYADGNASKGPIPEGAFVALVRAGRVQPTTLVWHEGMAEWIPLSEAAPDIIAAAATAADAGDETLAAADRIVCIECGAEFPRSECIGLPGGWVCAACKPLRVQKLKEGAVAAAAAHQKVMAPAGFWIRLGAKLLDGLLMGVVLGPLYFLLIMARLKANSPEEMLSMVALQLGLYVVQFGLAISYNTFFIGKFGATPGKMVCGIRVVTPDGAKLTYARALGRAAAEILSGMICDIGYIIAAFDEQKRALHDHIAGTRVVHGPRF